MTASDRRCDCGTRLSRYNPDPACAACQRTADLGALPPLPSDALNNPLIQAALARGDLGVISNAYRQLTGVSQDQVAEAVGLAQSTLSRLESGGRAPVRDVDTLTAFADGLGIPRHLFGLADPGDTDWTSRPDEEVMEDLEVLRRLEYSDVGQRLVEAIQAAAVQLSRDYSTVSPAELRARGREYRRQVLRLLDKRMTLAQHRELLVATGWLSLLIGCVEYDLGLAGAAETSRITAAHLGQEAGHTEIEAWAEEMAAWFALTRGDYRAVVEHARNGQEIGSDHSVTIQLAAHEGRGQARMGNVREMEEALARGHRLSGRWEHPADPLNHFVVDPAKFDFYAMDVYRLAGQDDKAAQHAREVLRHATGPDGIERSPMRAAEARLTLAWVAARRGELDQAVAAGVEAFGGARKSLPSLLAPARELECLLRERYPGESAADDLADQLEVLSC